MDGTASTYSGFVVVLDEPARNDWLESRRGEAVFENVEWRFTDALSAPDWHPKALEVCFLSFGGSTLDLAALATRGRKVANAKYAVTYSHFVDLGALPFPVVEATLGNQLRQHFVRSSTGRGSRVPPQTWAGLLAAAMALRPAIASDLERLVRLREEGTRHLRGNGIPQLAMERDAVGIALEIFGADRRGILSSWAPGGAVGTAAPLAPFLAGLRASRMREDQMLTHDARTFPGWALIAQHQVGTATFQKRDGEYLTIYNVNRTTIENALGVDLVYYNHRYDAYVMVQYKRLLRDGRSDGDPVFRLSGGSYETELEKMRQFVSANPVPQCDRPDRYRLEPAAFYLKLCEAETLTPLSGDLIKGMYVPLPYWEALLASGVLVGRRGGLSVSFRNMRRHLPNGSFVQLVQDGWIGSRGTTSDAITRMIRTRLEEGVSVLLAVTGQLRPTETSD